MIEIFYIKYNGSFLKQDISVSCSTIYEEYVQKIYERIRVGTHVKESPVKNSSRNKSTMKK